MKSGTVKRGFTLIEMIMVVALIVILVSMVVGITKRIDDQGKERLCRDTLALLDNALEQFRDFGFEYKNSNPSYTPAQVEFYQGLSFPIDCNGFDVVSLQNLLRNSIYPQGAVILVNISPPTPYEPNDSGSAALYYCLRQIPECRQTLDKIDKSLLAYKNSNGAQINISLTVNSIITETWPFLRFTDPWGTALRYDYYEIDNLLRPIAGTEKTFPVITSAGPDKQFGTSDDIVNRQGK